MDAKTDETKAYEEQKQKLWEAVLNSKIAYYKFVQDKAITEFMRAVHGKIYKYHHLLSPTTSKKPTTFPSGFKSKLHKLYIVFHPDKNTDRKDAHECMALINSWVHNGECQKLEELFNLTLNPDEIDKAWTFLQDSLKSKESSATEQVFLQADDKNSDNWNVEQKQTWLNLVESQFWISWATGSKTGQQITTNNFVTPEEYEAYCKQRESEIIL